MDQSVAAFSTMPQRQVRFREESVYFRYKTLIFFTDVVPDPAPHSVQSLPLPPHGHDGDVCPAPPAAGVPSGQAKEVSYRTVSVYFQCNFIIVNDKECAFPYVIVRGRLFPFFETANC